MTHPPHVDAAPAPRSPWPRVVLAAAFAAGVAAFFLLGGHRVLTFDALREHREALLDFTARNYAGALIGATLAYAVLTALSVPGGAVMSLAMGLLFGRWVGTAAVVVAATTGATAVFLAARYLVGGWARRRLGGRGARLARAFERDAFHYLLFTRLVPVFPFWLVNLAPALTGVRLRTFVLATFVGIVPGTFVFVNLGESLGRIDSARDLLSTRVLLALSLLGALALVPIVVRRLRGRPAEEATV
jgi:uncharacterized membrane protein YdjX (TVP38/TMEM64 family)